MNQITTTPSKQRNRKPDYRYTDHKNELHDARTSKSPYTLQTPDIITTHEQITSLLTALHPASSFSHVHINTFNTIKHELLK